MTPSDVVTIQQLEGGSLWHCPDVSCSHVTRATHDLTEPGREVVWNDEKQILSVVDAGRPMKLSDMCNECRAAIGWEFPWG